MWIYISEHSSEVEGVFTSKLVFSFSHLLQPQEEAAKAVSAAVERCTSRHKTSQREAVAKASKALRQTLEDATEDEKARTKTVLET